MSIRLTLLSWTFNESASTPVLFAPINTQVANNMHRSLPMYHPRIKVCCFTYLVSKMWPVKVAKELHAPVKFNLWFRGKSCLWGYCKICTVWTWEFPVHESAALFDTGMKGIGDLWWSKVTEGSISEQTHASSDCSVFHSLSACVISTPTH